MKQKHLHILAVLVALFLVTLGGRAEVWKDSYGVNYEYTPGQSEACVKAGVFDETIGQPVAGSPEANGDIQIRSSFVSNGERYTVTSIGWMAFKGCDIKNVSIPSTIKEIDDGAWADCQNLQGIYIEDLAAWCAIKFGSGYANGFWTGASLFIDGRAVTSLVIPDGVKSISQYAFCNMSKVISVTIPSSVESIGYYAFAECIGLTTFNIPSSVMSIGGYNFIGWRKRNPWYNNLPDGLIYKENVLLGYKGKMPEGNLEIKDGTKLIAGNAFEDCESLTSVIIPGSVTSIGDDAFSGCSGLNSIIIPKSVTEIGKSAFQYCNGLNEVYSYIEEPFAISGVDNDCPSFPYSKITLYVPASTKAKYEVTEGWKEFKNIVEMESEIKELKIDDTFVVDGITYQVKSTSSMEVMVGNGEEVAIDKERQGELIIPASVTASDGKNYSVTSIGRGAFKYCLGITAIIIPNTVVSIASSAFFQTGITSLNIPASVTKIGLQAFEANMNIDVIKVEEGNAHFDSRDNCNAIIESITNKLIVGCKNTTIPNSVLDIGEGAFYGLWGLKSIAIPNSVKSIGDRAFQNCELKEIHSYIEEPFKISSTGFDAVFDSQDWSILYVPAATKAKYEATDGWKEFKNIVEMTPYEVKEDGTAIAKNLEPDEDGKLVIPEKVEIDGKEYVISVIAADAFKDNTDMISVTIPESIEEIGANAFAGCTNLKEIHVLSPTPIAFSAAAARGLILGAKGMTVSQFDGVDFDTCILYVPFGSEQAYGEAEGWREFKHIVGVHGETDPTLTVTAKNYTREYGEENPTFEFTTEGATLDGEPVIECEATATSGVGTYDIVIKKGSVKNYNDSYVNGTLTITKAPLTVKVGSYTKKQGEDNPEFTLTYEGFKNDETSEVLTKQPVVTTEAVKGTESGKYEITVSGAEAENYDINYVMGELTVIDADAIVLTAKSYTREYGEENPSFEFTTEGATLDGEPVIECEATATSAVGTYDIVIKKGGVTNYNDSYVNGTLTITKALLTVKVGSYTKKQGEDNPEFTITYEGFKNDETSEVLTKQPVVTTEAVKEAEPGKYEITVSGAEAENYDINYVMGELTVTDADAIILTAKSYTREYGEENPTFEFTTEGATLDGEPVIECEATATSGVGTYDIVIKKGSVKNYNDSYVNGTLTITKAPLTVSVKDVEREQGEDNPQFEIVYSGWKLQDTESVLRKKPVATTKATKDSPVGEYVITVSGGEAENYELKYQNGKLIVTVPSGISNVTDGRPFDVYTVTGRKVCHQVTTLKGLPKGVYIVNGKKVVKN